jgi:hypothetical protein
MLWDPIAACGSPFFFSILIPGTLDPIFALAVLLGKLFYLDILQTFWAWIILRDIPILIGVYWLMSLYCRNIFSVLCSTIFLFFSFSFCLLRDAISFVYYWPLLLATLTYFYRSLKQRRPSIPAFFGSGVLFFISCNLYNPTYTLIFLFVIALSWCIINHQSVIPVLKSIRCIKFKYWIAEALIIALLFCPWFILLKNYRGTDYFAFLRTHQAAASSFHPISRLLRDSLDYVEVNPTGSPTRNLWELASCLFPFYYAGPARMEGTVYFGFLGLLGVLAGAFFHRNKAFLIYLSSALLIYFLMSPLANGFLQLASPALPFLKILNQRHLFYPAFLICVGISSCIGLQLLLDYSLMRKLAQYINPTKVLLIGVILFVAGFLFLWIGGVSTTEVITLAIMGYAPRLFVIFLLAMVSIALFLRLSVKNPKFYYPYIIFILIIFLIDLSFFCGDLSKYYHRNDGVFAKSRMLRERINLKYQPYRAPLLPIMYGTQVYSVAHLAGLPTALPAYWHTDIFYTSQRYYYLFSALSPAKLRHILGIDTPLIRIFSKSVTAGDRQGSILKMQNMSDEEILDTVVLEELGRKSSLREGEEIFFSGGSAYRKLFKCVPNPKEMDKSFYMTLYDSSISIPTDKYEPVPCGVYHQIIFRIPFDLELPATPDGEVDISRCFFPDFPYLADVNGKFYYFNKGFYLTAASRQEQEDKSYTMMHPVNGKGILLEMHGDILAIPKKVYFQKERLPLPEGIKVTSFDVNRVEILTEQPNETILYYGDLYDENWKATIDGQPTKIFIANQAFKAIKLPAGRHCVVFEYKVPYFILALSLYYLCIICFIIWLVYLWIVRSVRGRQHIKTKG